MEAFKINLTVKAENKEQLAEKLQAFQDLNDALSHEDFINSVDVIVENPEVVEFVKEVVPEEGKELLWTDYLVIAKKAFERFGD